MRNKVLALIFILIIGTTAISQQSYIKFSSLTKGILDSQAVLVSGEQGRKALMEKKWNSVVAGVGDEMLDTLPYKTGLIRLNGTLLKSLGTRNFYSYSKHVNISTDGYVLGNEGSYITADYEVEQITALKEYLDNKGINLLYVNEPIKYTDDNYFKEQFGKESYSNKNADLFLSRIDEAGINYIDLRDNISDEGIDCKTLFYRTDHHWTLPAGKWAAEIVADRLNESCGYDIDMSLLDDNNFKYTLYEKVWLGEQGKLISETYLPPDDYTLIEPLYDTDFIVEDHDGDVVTHGDFDIFINRNIINSDDDLYSPISWHYIFDRFDWNTVHNNKVSGGKVLMLTDSYGTAMAPFMFLYLENMEVIEMRDTNESIRDIIDRGDYDTIIIAYPQFELGAHTDASNRSYRMFDFE